MPRLKCASCGKSCRKGKFIACLHVLCVGCIEQNVEFDGSLLCPGCGTKTPSKPGGSLLLWLPNSLIEKPQEAEKGEASIDSLCDECAIDTPAAAVCQDCNLHLCETHGKGHPLFRKSHNHRVEPIVDVGAAESTGSFGAQVVRTADHRCAVHPSQKLTHYCMRCKELLCGTCIARGQHTQHQDSVQSVEEAAATARKCLQDKQDSCCLSVDGILPVAMEAVTKAIKEVNDQTENASDNASTFIKGRIEAWKKRECELLDELDQLRSAKLLPLEKQLGGLQECLSRSETVSTILECCQDDADILKLCGWLSTAIESQKSTARNETQPCVHSQLVFSSGGVDDLDAEAMQSCVVADVTAFSLVCPESCATDEDCSIEIAGQSSLTSQEMERLCLKVEVTAPDRPSRPCSLLSADSCQVVTASFQPISAGRHTVSAMFGGKHIAGSPAAVVVVKAKPVFESTRCHCDLAVSNDGHTLRSTANDFRSGYSSPLRGGISELRVRIDEISDSPRFFICACNSAHPRLDNYHQESSEVFGWFGFVAGTFCNGGALGQPWQNGDVIHLALDQDKHTLTGRHERTGVTETLTNVTGELYWYISCCRKEHQVTVL